VLIHHVLQDTKMHESNSYILTYFHNLDYFGNIGVDIFFIISGFIMVLIHGDDFTKPLAVRIFLLKRIIRVVPLYWILTGMATFILLFFPHLFGAGKTFDLYHTMASFFFIPWNNTAGMPIPILAAGWTLNYEMYFYLVFAFFLLLPKKIFFPGITFYFILSIGLSILNPSVPYFKMITNPLLLEFLLGIFVGLLYRKKQLLKQYNILLIISIGLFLSNLFSQHNIEYRAIYFGIPSALLIYLLLSYEHYKEFPLCGKVLGLLGTISYSLYLSHIFIYKFVIKIYPKIFGMHSLDIMILLAILASIGGGVIVYTYIEKPLNIYLTNKLSIYNAKK